MAVVGVAAAEGLEGMLPELSSVMRAKGAVGRPGMPSSMPSLPSNMPSMQGGPAMVTAVLHTAPKLLIAALIMFAILFALIGIIVVSTAKNKMAGWLLMLLSVGMFVGGFFMARHSRHHR